MPSETIKLTAKFKLKNLPEGLDELFSTCREIVNYLITYAFENKVTSFYRLKKETYKSLRREYPELPSHYVYTACQMATTIFKSYRKRERKGKASGKPVFKKEVIMLDDHLFRLDLEAGMVKLSTPKGRIALEFYPAKYHERFKDWKVGQAWLVKTSKGIFINVVFSKEIELREPKAFIGVDLNENNVTLSLLNGEFVQIITHEKEIRTGYFVKRRKIQKKLKAGKKRKRLLEKYGERERNKLNELYHKLANKIVEMAEKYGGIALEDLSEIRSSIRYSAEMNGRLHRWSFMKLQSIIEYKAKLKGVSVVFVNPAFTSSLCPICGVKLSPNGHRVLKCECGFEADRDVIGSWNIRLRALSWKVSRNEIYTLYKSYGQPERSLQCCIVINSKQHLPRVMSVIQLN
ncbi:RNA-guided endonuclease InsQ/TnpB family protein [Methermicoccus shengliensis]|uniref:RNA-guided endonuclease InsQ/TnpB family protein n=1 Tax=Methermicoccus shengliensis TaxID=660064 RepID=UPI00076C3A94|nr:RNA-guided endonuclease TnpB family protein [Methermicoccus shengliensis]KUK04553.1 MAG: IS element ISTsi1 orfB, putative trasposase [Euryarchaeota archaeon 55_53]KUK29625.1 MAG: IS element ISTsi1 orfB, putative trasposase [Methanosarcinales archeaon 56_1174]MDI3487763.1 putative transposase [Methanosarcinales archaeon]MDN5294881.1 putative transposase [Methanosarcinales archaeon]